MSMAMASRPFFLSKFNPSLSSSSSSSSSSRRCSYASAYMSCSSNYRQRAMNVDYLEQEFGGHGVAFKGIGENCVIAKMTMENGSKAILMLPNGLVASYKANMWHGGNVELLHSSVSEELDDDEQVSAAIQGGVSISLSISSDQAVSWSPRNWALSDITGSPEESIQVELICTDSHDMVQVKYIVTLEDDQLVSEVMVSNKSKSSPIQLSGSVLSHLTVSSPDATYAVGLERSDFSSRLPILSPSTIIPPAEESQSRFNRLWMPFMNQNKANQRDNQEEMEEGEEDDNYKKLTEKMCRIYTSAPRDFTIIDRGRRNSVVIGRDGFEELYVYSPGSSHEYYGKYAYICVGQSAVLKSIILEPNGSWTGGQRLHNPNM